MGLTARYGLMDRFGPFVPFVPFGLFDLLGGLTGGLVWRLGAGFMQKHAE
jgi:hypothetical protein